MWRGRAWSTGGGRDLTEAELDEDANGLNYGDSGRGSFATDASGRLLALATGDRKPVGSNYLMRDAHLILSNAFCRN